MYPKFLILFHNFIYLYLLFGDPQFLYKKIIFELFIMLSPMDCNWNEKKTKFYKILLITN
jgi:hypothetical protein